MIVLFKKMWTILPTLCIKLKCVLADLEDGNITDPIMVGPP